MFDLLPAASPNTGKRKSAHASRAKVEVTVTAYAEIDGVGMGLLSNGEPYLTQRGLAALCGVQNAHIGTISRDWATDKPRITAIKTRLGFKRAQAHKVLTYDRHRLFAYDAAIAQAVLHYYALDAGNHAKPEALKNRARFADNGLKAFIREQFSAPVATAQPLRFEPVEAEDDHDSQPAIAAFLMQVWSLYLMSFWMAVNHIEELRKQVAKAPWNRLGLYLPLKAFLEIQAEFLRRNGTLGLR